MRKFYQKDWHEINFSELGGLSIDHLPNDAFYGKFYSLFDKKYPDLSFINPKWLRMKTNAAKLICDKYNFKTEQSVLSLGVGLGVIERKISEVCNCDLHLHEVSNAGKRFFQDIVDSDSLHYGFFPDCIPVDLKFNFIILGGIEYVFNEVQFSSLLQDAHKRLKPGGCLILLSWSFYEPSLKSQVKHIIKTVLLKVGFLERSKSQLWGYLRSVDELVTVVQKHNFFLSEKKIDRSVKPWDTLFLAFDKK